MKSQHNIIFKRPPVFNYTNRSSEFELIYFILFHWNFRISEILNLNLNSLYFDSKIIVYHSKVKSYSIIRDEKLWSDLKFTFDQNLAGTFLVSYTSFRNWFYRYHPDQIIFLDRKNNKVTHSFRYRAAQSASDEHLDPKIIQAILTHKSIKTQNYYLLKTNK